VKTALKLFLFTLLVTAFYTYVGQMVPQTEVHPPKSRDIRPDMTQDELVEAGQDIVGGKGTCLGCHTLGADKPGRFPDLGGVGARAGKRKPGMTDVEYLAEALYEPNAYIVEGFTPGMPTINKPPIGLSDQEIIAVIAYLQSLGGTTTVTLGTHLKYASAAPASPASAAPQAQAAPVAAAPAPSEPASPHDLLQRGNCLQCHSFKPAEKSVGPGLYDVGLRLRPAQIYESIMDPDAVTAQGYPKGVMAAALTGAGFYAKTSASEIKAIVGYLSTQREKGAAAGAAAGAAKGAVKSAASTAAKGKGKGKAK
jgi:cytochrome c2